MTEGDVVTTGWIKKLPAGIIHLENMKYGKTYPIMLDDKKYYLKLSDDDHLWIVKGVLN